MSKVKSSMQNIQKYITKISDEIKFIGEKLCRKSRMAKLNEISMQL